MKKFDLGAVVRIGPHTATAMFYDFEADKAVYPKDPAAVFTVVGHLETDPSWAQVLMPCGSIACKPENQLEKMSY